mmetsp:Transcript_23401/g.30378  ORF Transcript_23401/g.30378 Transcript_23401/m.30378 type:complete len:204 (+) Transcript_23401:33-644(+)
MNLIYFLGMLLGVLGQEAVPPQRTGPVACPYQTGGYDDRFAVAQVLLSQRNMEAAESCLNDAIAATLGSFSLLSDIAAARQQTDRALAFSTVLEILSPRDGDAIFLHTQRLIQSGRYKDAVTRLRDLRQANPQNAAIANTLGVALFHTKDFQNAKAQFDHALALMPNNTDYKANLDSVNDALFGSSASDDKATNAAAAVTDEK